LCGFIASQTTLPVIGVPIDSSPLKGLDAMLATVQMPGGIPVATMSLGKAGAKNAGIFAAQIVACSDVKVANRLKVFRVEMEREVEEKGKRLAAMTALSSTAPETEPASEPEHAADAVPGKKKPRRRRWKKKTGGAAPAQGPSV